MNPAEQFLQLPLDRRARAFEQAATQRAVSTVIIEKDFWVCWLLSLLFSEPSLAPHLVFKGGTSLSKVYGVIDRFSEDVDLSLSPAFVGADAEAFEKLTSRHRRDAAVADMQRLCGIKTQDVIAPSLETAISAALSRRGSGEPWLAYEFDEHSGSPTLHFQYPATQIAGLEYVRRAVKLELGSLTDQQPSGLHAIRPWVVEELPAAFPHWRCNVTALGLARSFWEKATILHAEYHRPADDPIPDRYARHYSDVARILSHRAAATFLADKALCARVADWKNRVFPRRWARYELARHGSFRLVPPLARQATLTADYAVMRPMFLSDPPPFSAVLAVLSEAEGKINAM